MNLANLLFLFHSTVLKIPGDKCNNRIVVARAGHAGCPVFRGFERRDSTNFPFPILALGASRSGRVVGEPWLAFGNSLWSRVSCNSSFAEGAECTPY